MNERAARYIRVSTDEQAKDDRYGVSTQLKACREYTESHGYTVDDQAEFIEDYSGVELYRPELDKLRELAKAGALDVIVVYDIDRLSRNAVHQFLIEDEFKKYGVRIEYVTNVFGDTPEGRLQKLLLAGFAELEHAKIRERMMRGKKGRAEAGYPMPGRTAPYGYRYVKEDRKGWFEIDEEEARVVLMIYHWYVFGDETGKKLGIGAIMNKLSQLKIPTKNDKQGYQKRKDKGVWGHTTVYRILSSEVYKGDWYYRRREYHKGKYTHRDRDEWIHIQVPPIVSAELWEAARRQAEENNLHSPRNSRHPYLLRGRLICGTCGTKFSCYTYAKRNNRSYYICKGRGRGFSRDGESKTCTYSYRREIIDDAVWQQIKTLLQNPQLIFQTMEQSQQQVDANIAQLEDQLVLIRSESEAIGEQISRAIGLYLDANSPITKEDVELKVDELKRRREQFISKAQELERQIEAANSFQVNWEEVQRFCEMVRSGIEQFTFEDKQNVIEALELTAVVNRGATPQQDVIELRGYIPRLDVSLAADADTVKVVSPLS